MATFNVSYIRFKADKFFGARLRGVISVGVENCHLPLTKPVAVNTGLALPHNPWFVIIY